MNDVSQNKKNSILKSLAITGFISIIILIAWLSVQFIKVVPDAFSSLASLAEVLNQRQDDALENNGVAPLVVTSNTVLVNVGEPVNITWGTTDVSGSYIFSYVCADGVAVDIIEEDGLKSITCDANYNVGDINSLSLSIDSEKERYVDINYTVSFLGTNDTEPRASGTASLTVINNDNGHIVASTEEEEVVKVTEPAATEIEVPAAPVVETGPETTTYEQEFVYTIPVSDPNGRTDLATKYLNTGTIVGNTFFAGEVKQDESGAIQFEVKNYGSKTSDDWIFTMTLPNGGTYTSNTQKPLKPNERALLTIGFPTTDAASHTFVVIVDESTDKNIINNTFSQKITFLK